MTIAIEPKPLSIIPHQINQTEYFTPSLSLLNQLSPVKYLFNITSRLISEPEKTIIDNLIKTFQCSSAIINCLLHFSYFKNHGAINGNYIVKIAETLQNLNITDVQETITHLKNAYYRSQHKPIIIKPPIIKEQPILNPSKIVDAEEELLVNTKMQKIIHDYGLKTIIK